MGQYSGKLSYNNWLFGYLGIGSFFTQPQMEIILPSCFCIFVIIASTFIRVFMICFFHLRLSLDINCDKFKWLYVDASSGFWRGLDIGCCSDRNLSFYLEADFLELGTEFTKTEISFGVVPVCLFKCFLKFFIWKDA